jgi:hypothetical protein
MQKEAFCAPTVYNPVRYAQGLKTTGGTIVWISGQVSQDKDGKVVHKGDFSDLSLRFIDTCMIFTCYFKDLLKTFEGAS